MDIKTQTDFRWYGQDIITKADRATFRTLNRAAAAIRLTAKRSMKYKKKRGDKAPEGMPPNTHSKRLPNAIIYAVDKQNREAVIGPSFELIRDVGGAHEQGLNFRGHQYRPRPFMYPAATKIVPKMPAMWAEAFGK